MTIRTLVAAAAAVFALSTLGPTAHAQISFDSGVSLPTGVMNPAPGPRGVTAGDLDGDRFPDLVVPHAGDGSVAILLNGGAGAYTPHATIAVGADPRGAALGDLNGDGRLDIAVANAGSATVSVILNLGSGSFSAPTNLAVGTDPRNVTIADLNGDQLLDLVTANNGSNDVSILLNTGGATFLAATNVSVGLSPRQVAVADITLDGNVDIATANSTSADVTLLAGDGAGNFTLDSIHPTNASFTNGIQAGDVDRDGDADLVSCAFLPPFNVAVLINDAGTLAAATNASAGTHWQALALADVDVDGDLDVLGADVATDVLQVLENDGTGTFTAALSAAAGSNVTGVTAADADGDFIPDVFVSSSSSNDVTLFANTLPGPVLGECGRGNVGDGQGGVESLLTIDGSDGGAARRVEVALFQNFLFEVAQPSGSATPASFLIWGMAAPASLDTVTSLPFPTLSDLCLIPYHLAPGFPGVFCLTNNFGLDPAALVASTPAPWSQSFLGSPTPLTVTFQGLVLTAPGVVNTLNGVILDIR